MRFSKLGFSALMLFSCGTTVLKAKTKDVRPNFLVVVVDDMGYSDLGCFGSEIRTPNIDKLAQNGIINTNFHTSALCAPSRSMLLSGCDNHEAGMGTMEGVYTFEEQRQSPRYEGVLSSKVTTIPEVLREDGYDTMMTGKWHLGDEEGHWPYDRGFTHSFSMLKGGGSHFADRKGLMRRDDPLPYVEDNHYVTSLPEDFYSSRFYTDKMISYLKENRKSGKPFFAYLAYTAPHDPVQVPEAWLDKYNGVYDLGYDVLSGQRMQGAINKGIVNGNVRVPMDHRNYKPWNELSSSKQKYLSRSMEVYASMIEYMDQQIGRVFLYLKKSGRLENTYVIFISDNGSNPKPHDFYAKLTNDMSYLDSFDLSYDNIGRPNSFASIEYGFAQATNSPKHYVKTTSGEGGVNTPFIISGPMIAGQGEIKHEMITSMDVKPTILELAKTESLPKYNGIEVLPERGVSLLPYLKGNKGAAHDKDYVIAHEIFGSRYIRVGDYKLTNIGSAMHFGDDIWRLYNLKDDPSETTDISKKHPEIVRDLLLKWNEYKNEVGIIDYL
ncbi:MAG: arylsulfatase [Prolixibacteraceae bacterium]|jgi:arylsulfatase|nr:arylsulfatase [Prolixibacteraceae bacterium]